MVERRFRRRLLEDPRHFRQDRNEGRRYGRRGAQAERRKREGVPGPATFEERGIAPRSGAAYPLKPANRLDRPEVAAQVLEVNEDVVESVVAIGVDLRNSAQLIFGRRRDRLLGVREGEPCVADDFLLIG